MTDRERPTDGPSHRRGEAVVDTVLDAALGELARVGYDALSLSKVAARAGVHRTTIYRRWPSKVELVRATMERADRQSALGPSTGSLRGDLTRFVETARRSMGTAGMADILRRGLDSEDVDALRAAALEAEQRKHRAAIEMLAQAEARGEYRTDLDKALFLDSLLGLLFGRVVLMGRPLDAEAIDDIVDYFARVATPQRVDVTR